MKVAQDHREDLEVLLVLEHILIQAGAIKDIQITEDRDLLVPLRDTVDTLHTLVAMEDILPTLKAIHKVIEVRVHVQATLHHRDLPVLSHPRDHPQKRKGDSPAVMMVDQKVRSLG